MAEEGPRQNKTVVYECELCDHLSRTEEEASLHRDVPIGPTVDIGLVYIKTAMHREKHTFVVTGDNSKPREDHRYHYTGKSLEDEMPDDFEGKEFRGDLMKGSYSLPTDEELEEARAIYQAMWEQMDDKKREGMPKPKDLKNTISPLVSKKSK